jgi:hypothetical protein
MTDVPTGLDEDAPKHQQTLIEFVTELDGRITPVVGDLKKMADTVESIQTYVHGYMSDIPSTVNVAIGTAEWVSKSLMTPDITMYDKSGTELTTKQL